MSNVEDKKERINLNFTSIQTNENTSTFLSNEINQGSTHENFNCKLTPIYTASTANSTDRFIPPRFGQNFDLSRYHLKNRNTPNDIDSECYLNVFEQIASIDEAWRKQRMIKVLDELNIVSGIGSGRIFNFSSVKSSPVEREVSIYQDNHDEVIETSSLNDVWKVRARSRPLIGEFHHTLKLSGYRRFPSRGAIDWSSTDVIVAAIQNKLKFFSKKNSSNLFTAYDGFPEVGSSRIRCIQWNHSGDYIAMCSASEKLVVYDVKAEKLLWHDDCSCENCTIRCICWTNNSKKIITGCSRGKLSVFCATCPGCIHRLVFCIQAHDGVILNIGLSPNNRYVMSTGLDKNVRVYLFPEMRVYLEIGYYDAADAYAWHPWENGLLCIGGGLGDGSLSIWDISKQQCIGYRRLDTFCYAKHLAWNKLSGELVVVWYHWDEDRTVTVPVLSSWDKIVDFVYLSLKDEANSSIANVIWNPDHTVIGLQMPDGISCLDIFGNHANVWKKKLNKKKPKSIDHKSIFNLYSMIR